MTTPWHKDTETDDDTSRSAGGVRLDLPTHDAVQLTAGGNVAPIVLGLQTYTLRITRQGKLILTK